jgi:hypothetical protein
MPWFVAIRMIGFLPMIAQRRSVILMDVYSFRMSGIGKLLFCRAPSNLAPAIPATDPTTSLRVQLATASPAQKIYQMKENSSTQTRQAAVLCGLAQLRCPPCVRQTRRVQTQKMHTRARDFWQRISDGIAVQELWSQFSSEARASYRLYSREVDWTRSPTEKGRQRLQRVISGFFWAMVVKLSSPACPFRGGARFACASRL